MNKRLFFVTALLVSLFCNAQQAYFLFNYKGKYGIVDKWAQEVVAANQYIHQAPNYRTELELYLYDNSDRKNGLYFDLVTGENKEYGNYYFDKLDIMSEPYSFIVELDGTNYLKNENSKEIIPLKLSYKSLRDLDENLVIGTLAPSSNTYDNKFILLKNNKELPFVFKIEADNYTPIYQETGTSFNDLKYIVFGQGKKYKIYDIKTLKVLHTFTLDKYDDYEIPNICEKLTGKVDLSLNEIIPRISKGREEMPKRFEVKKTDETYQLKDISDGGNKTLLTSQYEMKIFDAGSDLLIIYLYQDDDSIAWFPYLISLRKMLLPSEYFNALNLKGEEIRADFAR